jgi:hypothetical protein
MRIIYLDQNKWIELARVHHGRISDPELAAVLSNAHRAVASGDVVFPLSATHYMELGRIKDPGRRNRLGTVMWELSAGATFASYRAILIHELEIALRNRYPQVAPGEFHLIGKGVAHAFGQPHRQYRVPEASRSQIDPRLLHRFEALAQEELEKAAITGTGPGGIVMSPFLDRSHNETFKGHLERLYPTISQLPADKWEDMLYAMSLTDIVQVVGTVLLKHGLPADALVVRGKEDLTLLLEELPSRKIDIHLHRQVLRNPTLKPKLTDLEDWSGLGPACAYSDVVVCERHFRNLLLRDNFRPKAQVIADVRELRTLL